MARRGIKREKEREKEERNNIDDRYIKKILWRESNGLLKYSQMTEEMIETRRQKIIAFRIKQSLPKKEKGPFQCKCIICSKMFLSPSPKANVCSRKCANKKYANYQREIYNPKPEIRKRCKICQTIFFTKRQSKSCCSIKCKKKNVRYSKNHRQRARKFNVNYEYINPIKVFRRDQWHCQICGKLTPKNKRGTRFSNAPELDHRIPMSKGGGHLYSNVQCVCRSCNGMKSNNNNWGQLPLFIIKSSG